MDTLFGKEKKAVRHSLHLVRNDIWKKWQKPHAGSVKMRSRIPYDCHGFDGEIIDVVNDYHAYCIACQHHIYTRSDFEDENSLFIPHVNSHAHRINLESLPKWSEIFETVGDDDSDDDTVSSYYDCYDPEDYESQGSGNDEWRCIACDKVMSVITKNEYRTLYDEIQIHMAGSQHDFNEFLMNDPENSLMVSIGLTPVLRYLTTESECKICDAQISEKHGIVYHIKTKEHMEELESLFRDKYRVSVDDLDDEENQLKLFAKLVKFQTESASAGVSIVPTNMDYVNLSKKEKNKVENCVLFVENEIWKKWQAPNPVSIGWNNPASVSYSYDYEEDYVEVFNELHAYCSACELHIYSRSDPRDVGSYFIGHLNSHAHRFNLRHFSKESEIFEIYEDDDEGVCNACERVMPLITKGEKRYLDEEIDEHISTEKHDRNALLMDDEDESLLVSIALSPMLKCWAVKSMCKICQVPISTEFGNERHIKTPEHLANVRKLVGKYNFTTRLLSDVENLKEFFAKLVKNY